MTRIVAALALTCAFAAVADDRARLEERHGRDPLAATLGNGGLTLGIDTSGRVCALRWPSPGYHGHLTYDADVAATGITWGLLRDETIVWSGDPAWTHTRAEDSAPGFALNSICESLALSARVSFAVAAHADRFDMRIELTGALPGDRIVWFGDLTPTTRALSEIAPSGALLQTNDDFACFADDRAAVHFRPAQPGATEWERAAHLVEQGGQPKDWKRFDSGVWLAYTVSPEPEYRCVETTDDVVATLLAPRSAVIGPNAASLAIATPSEGHVSLTLWAAESSGDLDDAIAVPIEPAAIESPGPLIRALHVHQDRETGSIVRSVAIRPPLNRDWPRYGAWSIRALDLAGDSERAGRSAGFYLRCLTAEGALPHVLHPTGAPAAFAGLIDTEGPAWVIWATSLHVGTLPPDKQAEFIETHWESLSRLTHFLVNWAEDSTGIPWHAYDPALGRDRRDRSQIFTGHLALSSILPLAADHGQMIPDEWLRRKDQWDSLLRSFAEDPEFTFRPEDPLPFWAPEIFPIATPSVERALRDRRAGLAQASVPDAARALAEIALYGAGGPDFRTEARRWAVQVDPALLQNDVYAASATYVALNTGLRTETAGN